MSGIRYTLSGLMLFLMFKMYSLGIFDRKRKGTEKMEMLTNQQKNKIIEPKLTQIINCRKQWKNAIIVGICLIVVGQGLLAFGEQYLSSDITALLFSTVPIWITLIG